MYVLQNIRLEEDPKQTVKLVFASQLLRHSFFAIYRKMV